MLNIDDSSGQATEGNIARGNLEVLTEIEPMGCAWDTGTNRCILVHRENEGGDNDLGLGFHLYCI